MPKFQAPGTGRRIWAHFLAATAKKPGYPGFRLRSIAAHDDPILCCYASLSLAPLLSLAQLRNYIRVVSELSVSLYETDESLS
jgi:hypothetical protein